MRMTKKCGWSKNVLIYHIENRSYDKARLGHLGKKQVNSYFY